MTSRKILPLTLLFVFSLQLSFSQNVVRFDVHEVPWDRWDKFHEDSVRKVRFLSSVAKIPDIDIYDVNHVRVVDVDGMEPLDVVYSRSDNKIKDVRVYINDKTSFHLAYNNAATLMEMTRQYPIAPMDFKVVYLDSIQQEFHVDHCSPSILDGRLTYHVDRIELITKGTYQLYRNMPPIQFKVVKATPLVVGPGFNALVRNLSPGEVGYAAASTKTAAGEAWWKVFIQEPGYKVRMGWLRREDVETVFQR